MEYTTSCLRNSLTLQAPDQLYQKFRPMFTTGWLHDQRGSQRKLMLFAQIITHYQHHQRGQCTGIRFRRIEQYVCMHSLTRMLPGTIIVTRFSFPFLLPYANRQIILIFRMHTAAQRFLHSTNQFHIQLIIQIGDRQIKVGQRDLLFFASRLIQRRARCWWLDRCWLCCDHCIPFIDRHPFD